MNQKSMFLLLAICSLLIIVGCGDKVDYIDVTDKLSCVEIEPNDWYGTIINSEEQLQTLVYEKCQQNRFPSDPIPDIDFSKYTILGMDLTGGGCKRTGEYFEVSRDDIKKVIYVKGGLKGSGLCQMAFQGYKWVLIPKITDEYKISWNSRFSLTEKDFPEIEERLRSGNFHTVYSTLFEIEKLGEKARPLAPVLVEIFEDHNYSLNLRIATLAIKLDPASADKIFPSLMKILETDDADEKLTVAIPLIIEMGRGKEIIPYIVDIIENVYPTGGAAFANLADIGEDALPTLYELAESNVQSIRILAAENIIHQYPITKEHAHYLIMALEEGIGYPQKQTIRKIKELDPESRQEINDIIQKYGETYDFSPSNQNH